MKELLGLYIKIIREHLKNCQIKTTMFQYMTEVFKFCQHKCLKKIHRGLSPEILRGTFVPKTILYNLRKNDTFERCQVHSVYHGTKSLSFLGSKIWDFVPVELKQSKSLDSFKLKIKYWIPFAYP